MQDIQKLVDAHLKAWTIRDADERAVELTRVYPENITVVEPDGIVRGRDALNARIGRLREHFGGLAFSIVGAISHHHGYVMYQ